jgi:exodeoxyribonuclease VII small subunit
MTRSSSKTPPVPETFEAGLEELDSLVQGLERGELSLDESVDAFERGTHLLKALNEKLKAAETRVNELVESEDGVFSEREVGADLGDDDT